MNAFLITVVAVASIAVGCNNLYQGNISMGLAFLLWGGGYLGLAYSYLHS